MAVAETLYLASMALARPGMVGGTKLYPSGRQAQIVPVWPPGAGKLRSILFMLHVTGVHAGTRVQIACGWRPLGYNLNATGR
jgi:hypothetical protein